MSAYAIERLGGARKGSDRVQHALDAVFLFACKHKAFTCEMVRQWADRVTGRPAVDARAWGVVMRRAVEEGWIESTSVHVTARDRTVHRRPVRVWKSKLNKGVTA